MQNGTGGGMTPPAEWYRSRIKRYTRIAERYTERNTRIKRAKQHGSAVNNMSMSGAGQGRGETTGRVLD